MTSRESSPESGKLWAGMEDTACFTLLGASVVVLKGMDTPIKEMCIWSMLKLKTHHSEILDGCLMRSNCTSAEMKLRLLLGALGGLARWRSVAISKL